eukprot:1854137-Ditylum_brightwellii.AAC.1
MSTNLALDGNVKNDDDDDDENNNGSSGLGGDHAFLNDEGFIEEFALVQEDVIPQQSHWCIAHAALLLANFIFGSGSVVGTLGLPSFHPLTFALIRESFAAVLLLAAAEIITRRNNNNNKSKYACTLPQPSDIPALALCGSGIFASQAFFVVGIKLSQNAVAGSVWQPSQPIFTAAICMMMRWEPFSLSRLSGILLAFLGCAGMIVYGRGEGSQGGSEYGTAETNEGTDMIKVVAGQACFFINCLGSSIYVLACKNLTNQYHSISITAWSYTFAALLMAIFAFVCSMSTSATIFLCNDCEPGQVWNVPSSAVPALAFFIVMQSSIAYGLVTWATKRIVTGTLVTGYTVLQPVTSALLTEALIVTGSYAACGVENGIEEKMMRVLNSILGDTSSNEIYRERLEYDLSNEWNSEQLLNGEGENITSNKACLQPPNASTLVAALAVFAGLFIIVRTEPETSSSTDGYEAANTMIPSEHVDFTSDDLIRNDDDSDEWSLLELSDHHKHSTRLEHDET